ncbi:MAG: hypothetical protein NTW21_35395 [Verrucomicrobia bacterium]|nr:hypothetical protein [Verrucomicrobiota bacterium]
MKLEEHTKTLIIEEVRAMKRENAAEHGFDVSRIVAAARERQEQSGRMIVRRPIPEGEQDAAARPA